MSQRRRAKLWGLALLVWALIAVFGLGVLDLEPQLRPAGAYEPSLIGQTVGVVVFLLIARKYMLTKGWW